MWSVEEVEANGRLVDKVEDVDGRGYTYYLYLITDIDNDVVFSEDGHAIITPHGIARRITVETGPDGPVGSPSAAYHLKLPTTDTLNVYPDGIFRWEQTNEFLHGVYNSSREYKHLDRDFKLPYGVLDLNTSSMIEIVCDRKITKIFTELYIMIRELPDGQKGIVYL
jgi:hypothetical protein